MIVTRIEEADKSKVKIYVDGEYAFPFYQKDIGKYRLEEGKEISQEIYDTIMEETILYRAKEKAMSLLKFSDRTEAELRGKLKSAGFPDRIVNFVLDYVYSYGYINDERYAASYVNMKMESKSRAFIRMELLHRGIKKELIDKVLSEEYEKEEEDPEIKAIRKLVLKKYSDPDAISGEAANKLLASLYRKGFSVDKIRKVLRQE